MASLLQRLALEPAGYTALPSDAAEHIVDFLLRWQSYTEASACLDGLGTPTPVQLEQRAAALHGQGRTAEAIRILEGRMRTHTSIPLAGQLVRMRLAAGQLEAALAEARQLAGVPGQLVLGDALLTIGSLAEAEAVFLQLRKDAPGSRQAVTGLMRVEQVRGDLVSASSYAMRALDLARRGPELSVEEMLALRDVLQAGGDSQRVRELNRQLVERFDRDLAEMQAMLANARELTPPTAPAHDLPTPSLPASRQGANRKNAADKSGPMADVDAGSLSDWSPVSPAAALSSVTVSARERNALTQAARHVFGYAKLLPGQAEVLACVQRREHVLAVMPTGAGKSLCYQLPAFLGKGITLVVSPLVALMKDQIDNLPEALRRKAVAVNSSLDGDDLRRIVERIATRQYHLVYVAPERLRQLPFVRALRSAGVERLVVDEAHCVSIWGHDFRPDYLHLAQAHADLGGPPILAITATAPPRVRHDIERQLLGSQGQGRPAMRVLVGDSFRPNLQLTAVPVRNDEEQQTTLIELMRRLPAPGIVYARSRKRCDELAQLLVTYGVRAAAYHAGMEDRTVVQDRFMRDDLAIIVATVAFGMGIDKSNIRFIVHCGLPGSLEGYYQEIGRAGRDGQPAHCVLIYSQGDATTLTRLAVQDQITEDGVRAAYTAVQRILGSAVTGPVSLEEVAAAVRGTQMQARMLLGVLEQTGLIRRHYDAPQTLTIQRLPQRSGRRPVDLGDRTLADFLQRANLDTHQTAHGSFTDLAGATGIPMESLESRLLAWQGTGWLRYYPAGRVPLLSLLPAPANAAQRIQSLIARRSAVAQQRVQEIDEYARTHACRHSYLGEHLATPSNAPAARCSACDNCGSGLVLPVVAAEGPAPADHILATLAEQSWGRRTLIRLLRGDPEAPERAQASNSYGCLRERSEQSLGQLLDSLLAEGLIAQRTLDHGGVTLEATRLGVATIKQGGSQTGKSKTGRKFGPPSAHSRWHKEG